jgi:hypothetical protein
LSFLQLGVVRIRLGFIFPVGDMQGYVNLKGYKEFAAESRPDGWNTWVTDLAGSAHAERTTAKAADYEVASR